MVVHWLLVLSLALGAPMASCCQWGLIARTAVASVAAAVSPGHERCCCQAPPVDDERSPGENGSRCTCGPARSIFSEPGVERVGGATALAVPAPAAELFVMPSAAFAAPVAALAQPPPVRSLLRLHCALTI